jgi:hypothetical protein
MNAAETLLARSLEQPVPPEIAAMASHVRSAHDGVMAVLAYGSCLRGVATTDSLIDLYVLTRDLRGVSANVLSRLGCRLIPPNVYYAECDIGGQRYRAKYAVLPMPLFAVGMTRSNPYFWARFAQPSALVFAADAEARRDVISAAARAAQTMFAHARALSPMGDPLDIWAAGFRATYATELRAEAGDRADQLVAANESYYRDLAAALAATAAQPASWGWKRASGKLWAAARLIKASFTFSGGADYLVWKIERHSGQKIAISPWQRRHPVIAGLMLLPKLLASKAVR